MPPAFLARAPAQDREPALEVAPPASMVEGSARRPRHQWVQLRLRNDDWELAEVMAWARDTRGRWLVFLSWWHSVQVGHRRGWFVYDELAVVAWSP